MIPVRLPQRLLALAIAAALTGVSASAVAADPKSSSAASTATSASAADMTRLKVSKDIIGKQINGDQNVVLGTIDEVILDRSGTAQYLVVSPAKDLNLGNKRMAVPWTAVTASTDGILSTSISKDKFAKAPTWSDKQASAKDWDTKTYDYYGLMYVPEKAQFSQLDVNKDKQLSQEEAQANRRVGSNFKNLDKDSNGSISESEFSAFEEAMPSDSSSSM